MNLRTIRLVLGPMQNNVYLLGDDESSSAVVIDPGFESERVLEKVQEQGWTLRQIWLTHAHFDHIAGVAEIASASEPPLPIGLHALDRAWYEQAGGASRFGMTIPQPPAPTIDFKAGMQLSLGKGEQPVVSVRFAPGHSAGHVIFYCEMLGVLLCGDVIFRGGIGRTDLTGGDMEILLTSIREEVLMLPDETRLLPGHGPESTVGYERMHNPFL